MRIGIDVGGTKIVGIVLDGSTELLRLRVDTPRGDYQATIDAIAMLVTELEQAVAERGGVNQRGDIEQSNPARATVGVGIPGTLSPQTGLVKNANSVWLIGRPLLAD